MNEISREELLSYEQLYRVDHSIGDLTPTVCALHGLTPPETCGGVEIASVVDQAQRLMDGVGKNSARTRSAKCIAADFRICSSGWRILRDSAFFPVRSCRV